MFDVTTGQTTQVAQHDAPIKVVKWIETPQMGVLATGSWDKTIKVSFRVLSISNGLTRISTGILDHKLPPLPSNYRKDVIPLTYNTLCSLSERLSVTYKFLISPTPLLLTRFSASAPMTETYLAFLQTLASPLKWQTRVVSCFTAAQSSGFAVGSIEGRVAIQ